MQLLLLVTENIEDFQRKVESESVFGDYGTVILVRGILSVVVAFLILIFVFYPIYTLVWKYLRRRFPSKGANPYMKGYKKQKQNDKDYEEYLEWAADNGYQPEIAKK